MHTVATSGHLSLLELEEGEGCLMDTSLQCTVTIHQLEFDMCPVTDDVIIIMHLLL